MSEIRAIPSSSVHRICTGQVVLDLATAVSPPPSPPPPRAETYPWPPGQGAGGERHRRGGDAGGGAAEGVRDGRDRGVRQRLGHRRRQLRLARAAPPHLQAGDVRRPGVGGVLRLPRRGAERAGGARRADRHHAPGQRAGRDDARVQPRRRAAQALAGGARGRHHRHGRQDLQPAARAAPGVQAQPQEGVLAPSRRPRRLLPRRAGRTPPPSQTRRARSPFYPSAQPVTGCASRSGSASATTRKRRGGRTC